MHRKRVLHVFAALKRRGAQIRTVEIYAGLKPQHQVRFDFFTTKSDPEPLEEEIAALGGQVYHSPFQGNLLRSLIHFRRLLAQEQYDVVHAHLHLFSGLFLLAARRARVPVRIAHFRNMHDGGGQHAARRLYRALMRRLVWRYATHIVGVSAAALRGGLGHKIPDRRCQIIYNGVDLAPFDQAQSDPQALRRAPGWPADAPVVINVARFDVQKNHGVILETAAKVLQARPDVRFLLVGDGDLRPQIEAQIERRALSHAVCCPGARSDVPFLLKSADLFFFPSLWEGLPGAVLEALAAGLSVVGSDIQPMQEIAPHFPQRAFLAGANASDQHARHILEALAAAPPLAYTLARQHFLATPFAMPQATQQFAALYGLT
jgi:glycosyltransferase involved in cell wall biosynthesis